MHTKLYDYLSQVAPRGNSSSMPFGATVTCLEEPSHRIGGMLLALLPALSFLGQYLLSLVLFLALARTQRLKD